MEDSNNNEVVVAPEIPVEVSETVNEMSQEQLVQVLSALKSAQPTNFKARFQGSVGSAKARVDMSWHNGELVPTAERNKLSWEEVHASNNVIRK